MGCTFALRTLEENQLKSMLSQAGGRVRIVPRWRGSATAARASGFFSVDGQLLDTFLAFWGAKKEREHPKKVQPPDALRICDFDIDNQ